MPGASVDDLRQRTRAAEHALADVTHQHKLAKRRHAAARAAGERAWTLSGSLLDETLLIYTLADCNVTPAVRNLASRAREHHWPPADSETAASIVTSAFLAADLDRLAALSDTDAPANLRAFRHATDVVQQWRLAEWASAQNSKGVAPSTASVLAQWEAARAAVPASVRPAAWGSTSEGAARMRASRWRHRHGGRFAKLPLREAVDVPTMQNKAPTVPPRPAPARPAAPPSHARAASCAPPSSAQE